MRAFDELSHSQRDGQFRLAHQFELHSLNDYGRLGSQVESVTPP